MHHETFLMSNKICEAQKSHLLDRQHLPKGKSILTQSVFWHTPQYWECAIVWKLTVAVREVDEGIRVQCSRSLLFLDPGKDRTKTCPSTSLKAPLLQGSTAVVPRLPLRNPVNGGIAFNKGHPAFAECPNAVDLGKNLRKQVIVH